MRMRYPQLHQLFAALLVACSAVFLWRTAHALSAGATPDKSNNPRLLAGVVQPAETCNKTGCHTTLPTAGCNGKVEVTGLPGCYVAGQVYPLTVTVTDANATRWGFEIGVQYNEGNANDYVSAGSIDNVAGERTQKVVSADGQRSFITHQRVNPNGDGTYAGQANSATWKVQWTAPGGVARQTPVCVYVAGLAADNDESRAGDCTYNTKVCMNPCGPTSTERSTWGAVKLRYYK